MRADLGTDSLDDVELSWKLEDEFHIKLIDWELETAKKVRDYLRLLRRHLNPTV